MMVLPPTTSGTIRGQPLSPDGPRGEAGSFQKTMQQLEQDVYQSGGKSVAFDGPTSGRHERSAMPDVPVSLDAPPSSGIQRPSAPPSASLPLALSRPDAAMAVAPTHASAGGRQRVDNNVALPHPETGIVDPTRSRGQELPEIDRDAPTAGIFARDRKLSSDTPVVTVFLGDDIPAISVQLKGLLGTHDKQVLMRMLQETFAQHGLAPAYAYLNGERLSFSPPLPASR